jgi:hypothetical protein
MIVLALTSSCGGGHVLPETRIGIYAWGVLPKTPDPLVSAVEDAQRLGITVFRTCISPYWDPRPDAADRLAPLDQKIRRADYQRVLASFPVVILTSYDAASFNARYRNRASFGSDERWNAMLRAVHEEFRRFAIELGKGANTIIVSSWESENDAFLDAQWPDYLLYLQARSDGIVDGRREAKAAGHPAKVFTAIEFAHVTVGFADPRSNKPARSICGLDAAVALHGVDFASYSAWENLYYTGDPRYTETKLRASFSIIRQKCRPPGCRFLIGEIGYLRNYDPKNAIFQAILEESLRAGAAYVVDWSEYDQPGQVDRYGFGVDQSKFGAYDIDRKLTAQGECLRLGLRMVR